MDPLIIPPTKKTLSVKCEKGLIELQGCSIANDAKNFFSPVMNWITEYTQNPQKVTTVYCKIDYVDSSSLKYIFEILRQLVAIKSRDFDLIINWSVDYNDPELIEMAEILESRLKLKFNYV